LRISVFGLGYVGVVSGACLAAAGHAIVGVDVCAEKVALIESGRSPIQEPGVTELVKDAVLSGSLRATTDAFDAVTATEVSIVSVGTPQEQNGRPDLSFVYRVVQQIAEAAKRAGKPHCIVLRSTVPPGTTDACRKIANDCAGDNLLVAFNPEFLREGCAVRDFLEPAYTVIGTEDERAALLVSEMYASLEAPIRVVDTRTAEMVKCVANAWHATKITFANEVGRMAQAWELDGRDVMRLIVDDRKLNVSSAYMRPGFAYGGSCLPKDVAALCFFARDMGVNAPLLASLDVSNEQAIRLAAAAVLRDGPTDVCVLGLAFKPDTDDLRESPAVRLVKMLLSEGCRVRAYDSEVRESMLVGSNLGYIRAHLPHFEALMVSSPEEAMTGARVTVSTYDAPYIRVALRSLEPGTRLVDLAGAYDGDRSALDYFGAAW
jgi:GDP-mannose 6-dehydrogenase